MSFSVWPADGYSEIGIDARVPYGRDETGGVFVTLRSSHPDRYMSPHEARVLASMLSAAADQAEHLETRRAAP